MLASFIESLQTWNKAHDTRSKLQHSYIVLAIATLVLAGLIGLINYNLGQSVLVLACGLILMFIANAVLWALLESFLLNRLSSRKSNRRKNT